MTDSNSIDYYVSRERRERALAEAATNPAISAIHLQMATHYAELIANPPRQVHTQSAYSTAVAPEAGGASAG